MYDGQIAHVSETICRTGHWLLDQLLTAAEHQVCRPLLEVLVTEAERVDLEDDICQCGFFQMAQLGEELKYLRLEVVCVLHQGHLMLKKEAADRKTIIRVYLCVRVMAIANDEVLKEVHHLYARMVKVIDEAVRLINCQTTHVQSLGKLVLPKVEEDSLTFLKTDSWKICSIRPSLNPAEGDPEEVLVAPEEDLTRVKVDQGANDVTYCPPLTEMGVLLIPFLNSVAIVRI